jgi:hypothetical protein
MRADLRFFWHPAQYASVALPKIQPGAGLPGNQFLFLLRQKEETDQGQPGFYRGCTNPVDLHLSLPRFDNALIARRLSALPELESKWQETT